VLAKIERANQNVNKILEFIQRISPSLAEISQFVAQMATRSLFSVIFVETGFEQRRGHKKFNR
jgi:hypothetical protein